jgi:hypothetical protein
LRRRERRIVREQRTVGAMIAIYCRGRHGTAKGVCDDCETLLTYAQRRLEGCPFGKHKPACNHCRVHCYSASMRERVQAVMRYAGPRMPLRHPLLSFFHLLDKLRRTPPRGQHRSHSGRSRGNRQGR